MLSARFTMVDMLNCIPNTPSLELYYLSTAQPNVNVTSPTRGMYYFAYGSNMVASQMATRCPKASVIGVACLQGYKFLINARRVGTVVPDPIHQVYGLLWEINPEDLRALDLYEEVQSGLYEKATVVVEFLSDRRVEALIYLATDQSSGWPRPQYMKDVVAAAKKWKLPPIYVEELAQWLSTGG
jgi:gamma-glutamylcyclotransferase (GGCT)/AIG2-like uncharacterized protein YtfP